MQRFRRLEQGCVAGSMHWAQHRKMHKEKEKFCLGWGRECDSNHLYGCHLTRVWACLVVADENSAQGPASGMTPQNPNPPCFTWETGRLNLKRLSYPRSLACFCLLLEEQNKVVLVYKPCGLVGLDRGDFRFMFLCRKQGRLIAKGAKKRWHTRGGIKQGVMSVFCPGRQLQEDGFAGDGDAAEWCHHLLISSLHSAGLDQLCGRASQPCVFPKTPSPW